MAKPHLRFYVHAGAFVAVLAVVGLSAIHSPKIFSVEYDRTLVGDVDKKETNIPPEPKKVEPQGVVVTHLPTPEPVKAIYMSQCVVGTPSFRAKLVEVADTTEINSIIIDIKDFSGRLGFNTENPKLKASVSDTCRAGDIVSFIDFLHKKNIYVIGRITVFQDPFMSNLRPDLAVRKISDGGVWKDHKGLSFIDVGAKEHWEYIAEISRESYKLGFDELNFDYIRFPSDGDMKDTSYTLSQGRSKPEALEEFFKYLSSQLKPEGIIISADLFGMVTTNRDDLNIGQVLERALPYFDYIAPMVYPSHYPKTFNGWSDPNKYPYELIKYVMTSAVNRANEFDRSFGTTSPQYSANSYKKLRPWLQDFDYGGTYDIPEVRAQIRGTYDAGLTSWMLWAPSNIYTKGALEQN